MDLLTLHKEQLKGESYWIEVFRQAIADGNREACESWKNTPQQQQTLRELEALITLVSATIPAAVKCHWESTWMVLAAGPNEYCQELNQELRSAFQKGISLLQELEDLTAAFFQAGFPISKQHLLPKAREEVQSLQNEVLAHWPIFSEEDFRKPPSGPNTDNLEVDSAFAEIAGIDLGQWRQRIESYLTKKNL